MFLFEKGVINFFYSISATEFNHRPQLPHEYTHTNSLIKKKYWRFFFFLSCFSHVPKNINLVSFFESSYQLHYLLTQLGLLNLRFLLLCEWKQSTIVPIVNMMTMHGYRLTYCIFRMNLPVVYIPDTQRWLITKL